MIWLPKLWAASWSPFLAIAGLAGAFLGWSNRDRKSVVAGLAGAITGFFYTTRVTGQKDPFAPVFGDHWEDRIPSQLKMRLPSRRYQLVQPAPPKVPGQRNVVIGTSGSPGHPLLCDIWEPHNCVSRTGLAIIFLHGGAWQAVDKDFLIQPLIRRLVGQGHVMIDVAYSLSPEANLDQMLCDVKQAILWMKSHASEYGIHPDRIVLMGEAGGAHLALLAAYDPDHPAFHASSPEADISVRAVVTISGITDLQAFFREYGETNPKQPEYSAQITDDLRPRIHDKTWLDRFLTRSRIFPAYRHANLPGGPLLLVYLLGGTLREIPEVYRLGSPLAHVGPHCPPTLILHGEDDFVVNVSHGRRLHQALVDAGVPSIYIEYPNTVHAFDQYFGVSRRIAPAAQSSTYYIERFLALMV